MTTQNKIAYTIGHTLMVVMLGAIIGLFFAATLDGLFCLLLAGFASLAFAILAYGTVDAYASR